MGQSKSRGFARIRPSSPDGGGLMATHDLAEVDDGGRVGLAERIAELRAKKAEEDRLEELERKAKEKRPVKPRP